MLAFRTRCDGWRSLLKRTSWRMSTRCGWNIATARAMPRVRSSDACHIGPQRLVRRFTHTGAAFMITNFPSFCSRRHLEGSNPLSDNSSL